MQSWLAFFGATEAHRRDQLSNPLRGRGSKLEDFMKLFIGFLVAFGIGAFCRWCRIPSPAPQAIQGSLLVLMMSVGYIAAGQIIHLLQLHLTVR
jgi:XapX domain-containing protein